MDSVLSYSVYDQSEHACSDSDDAGLKFQPGADKEEFLFILPSLSSKFSLSVTSFGALNKLLKFSVPPFPCI